MKAYSLLLLPIILLSAFAVAPLHAQQTVSLQEQMGSTEFSRAGLDKLSPAELRHLQQWLALHAPVLATKVPASDQTSATAAAAESSGLFGSKPKSSKPAAAQVKDAKVKHSGTITSHIAGEFNGWERGTVLTLQNGQKWRVSDDRSFTVRQPLTSPEVSVKPGFLGSWTLKVQGYNTTAKVEPAN
jgi:hypothetical protein